MANFYYCYCDSTYETTTVPPRTTTVIDGDIFYSHQVFDPSEIGFTEVELEPFNGFHEEEVIGHGAFHNWYYNGYLGGYGVVLHICMQEISESICDFIMSPIYAFDGVTEWHVQTRDFFALPHAPLTNNNLLAKTKPDFDDPVNCVKIFGMDMSIFSVGVFSHTV